ncbi:MAG: hypothetical protein AB1791_19100, partial [Chloroflexota bacterium]
MRPQHFLLIILLLAGWAGWLPAMAQDESVDGLDVLFIVDQSDSMARLTSGVQPNDPLGLRFYAPWYAMYWMGEDHLLLHPDVTFRLALVSFGSTAEVWDFGGGRHWQEIDPASRDAWQPTYDNLNQQLQGSLRDDFSQRHLGATNFVEAFEAAKMVFDELASGEGNRQRVIIVLTDGQPSIEGEDAAGHMRRLQELAATSFPEPGYRIYVVAMIDYSSDYWAALEPAWEQLTNDPCMAAECPDPSLDRASVVASNDDVGHRFQDILQDLTRNFPKPEGVEVVDEAVVPGPLPVPPYLSSITFTYFKSDPAEHLVLADEQGPIDLGQGNVFIEGQNGPIEAVRITNPQPGRWQVATDPPGVDVDITMRQIFARSELHSPTGPQVQYIPVSIQYALLDDLNQPLPSYTDPRYRLLVTANIQAGGQSWPIPLMAEPNNVYKAEFTPVLAEPHTIFVHAESQDPDGNPVIVFDQQIGSFNVSAAVLTPLDVPSQVQQYDETTFAFELQDDRGFPITTAAPMEVVVTITGENSEPLTLAPQPDGSYQATYSPQVAGPHTAHVKATVSDSSGANYTVIDADVGQFDVAPTTLVSLALTQPQEAEQTNTGLWPFARTPLVLEVQVVDDAGRSLEASQVFIGDPNQALQVTVTDEERNDQSAALVLASTGQDGLYRAETQALGMGQYDLRVQATGALRQGYLYRTDEVRTSIARVRHPLHLPIAGSLLALLLALTATIVVVTGRRRRAMLHPCTGRLIIVDADNIRHFDVNLSGYRRNRLEFTSKEINPITHVTRL